LPFQQLYSTVMKKSTIKWVIWGFWLETPCRTVVLGTNGKICLRCVWRIAKPSTPAEIFITWRCLRVQPWVSHQKVLNICDWHILCATARVWFCVRRFCSIHTGCSEALRTENGCFYIWDTRCVGEMFLVSSVGVVWCIFDTALWMVGPSRMFLEISPSAWPQSDLSMPKCTIGSVVYDADDCSW
jgi:hypothetical protein